MKKLLALVAAMMALIYLLPMLTVSPSAAADGLPEALGEAVPVGGGRPARESTVKAPTAPAETLSFDAKTMVTVRIDGAVQELPLHDYLIGVVAAEMPASFPGDALKAQALAARTYTLYKLTLYEDGMALPEVHAGAQLCDDPTHCKAYCDASAQAAALWGGDAKHYLACLEGAVTDTDGLIAVFEGRPIAAVFHAASGPRTEAAVDVWGSATPYLQSVDSPGGEESGQYAATVTLSQNVFRDAILAAFSEAVFPADPEQWFKASRRSDAGGIIDVAVGGVRVSGTAIRQAAGLNSTNFRVRIEGDDLIFTTTGYGHGVGMSQYGARALAMEGYTFDRIIKHYFTGVELLLKR